MIYKGEGFNSRNWLFAILAIAMLLRLSGLTGFSLSNDELSALARLQFDSAREVIDQGVYVDFHPAGVQLFLYGWTLLFGFGEWIVRLPFALMGVLSVLMIYKVGREWFGEPTGLLAAAALAVLEYPLLYSQIARPYSPGLLFSLMAAYFWTRLLFSERQETVTIKSLIPAMTGFVLSVSACMYIHYFSFIMAGVLCFTGLFFMTRKRIIPYLVCGFCIVVLYIPHSEIFLHQLSKGGVGGAEGWLGPPGKDAFYQYIDYVFNNNVLLKYIFLIITAGTVLAYRGSFRVTKFHLLSLIFFVVPFSIAYYYSIYKNPVFQHSVLLFSFPFLLLLLFAFIPRQSKGITVTFLLLVVISGGVYSTVYANGYYSTPHFSEFRKIARDVKEIDNKIGKDEITRVINIFHPYYINYYLDKFNHQTTFAAYSILNEAEKKKFYRIIDTCSTTYFLYAYSNTYDPPEYDIIIRSKFPWLVRNDTMLNSGLRLYTSVRSDSSLNILPFLEIENGFEAALWPGEENLLDSLTSYQGKYSIRLNKQVEFSPGLSVPLKSLYIEPGSAVELSCAFKTDGDDSGIKMVISLEKDQVTYLWKGEGISTFNPGSNNWFRMYMWAELPKDTPTDALLKIYCWNEKFQTANLDDLRIKIYLPR